MSYDLETYQEPFWATSGNFVRGRDPLGIQNSSISVYATLLPGMTNLTLRLRYYGLYLWLLDEYHNLPSDSKFKENPNGQYTFIRRAELMIAFLMVNKFPNELSVIGVDFAASKIDDLNQKGYYDIALGADKNSKTEKKTIYWDYISGALGQYYAGSLFGLNLMEFKSGFFERTEEYGKSLANAFRNSLSSDTAALFLLRILEGKLYESDLDQIVELSLNKEYRNTEEGDFYLKMLLSEDSSKNKTASNKIPSNRKESLQIFMNLLNNSDDPNCWKELPKATYEKCLLASREDLSNAELGWHYYYLNELAHFSLETVFWGMLMEMDRGNYSLQQFLTYITKQVVDNCSEVLEDNVKLSVNELLTHLDQNELITLDFVSQINDSVKIKKPIDGITQGVLMLLCLYRDNIKSLDEIRKYAVEHFLDTKHGNAIDVFNNYIESSKELNFTHFVQKIIHTLLNEHIAIAYNKMGNGEKNLLKFVVEDNFLVHIETMKPNFTNPRLRTLYNFNRDLGLIDAGSKLTPNGEELLMELNTAV